MSEQDDRPIHVRVAEVLGWTDLAEKEIKLPEDPAPRRTWFGKPGAIRPRWFSGLEIDARCAVDQYDEDWSATGPLIEYFRIRLTANDQAWFATTYDSEGDPFCWHLGPSNGFAPCDDAAPTPLLAVCRLILALAADEELPR